MLESKIIKEIAKLKKIQTSISHASTYFDQITKPLSENDPSSILNISNKYTFLLFLQFLLISFSYTFNKSYILTFIPFIYHFINY